MKTRVFGYVRLSPRPEEGLSIDNQIAKLRAQCVVAELELVDIIVDRMRSGKDLERPGLQQLLTRMRAGEADGVLVVKLDRLTRSVRDLGELLEEHFADRSLHCIEFAVDTRSANGRMVLNLLMTVAQWERETIVERTKDALRHRKEIGVTLGAPSLGEKRVRTVPGQRCEIQVDEAGAAAIARIHALSATGIGSRAIAEQLNAEGVPTRKNAKWHRTQIDRVLARKVAA